MAAIEERGDWSDVRVQQVATAWKLEEKEVENLKKLGSSLSDVQHWKNDPKFVVNFLKAQPKKLQKAEDMFRKMVAWRLENKVDTILDDYKPPELLDKYYPIVILKGVSKEGAPIVVERLGAVDLVKIYLTLGKDEVYRHAIWLRERATNGKWIKEYEEKHGMFTQIFYIEDMGGFNLSYHFNHKAFAMHEPIAQLDNVYYPELPYKVVACAPFAFRVTWAIVKYFFEPAVRNKIEFCSVSNFSEVLSKYVDVEVLPSILAKEGKGEAMEDIPLSKLNGGPFPDMKKEEDAKASDDDNKDDTKTPAEDNKDDTKTPTDEDNKGNHS